MELFTRRCLRAILQAAHIDFQLWANLPAALKMTSPRYQEVKSADIPGITDDDGTHVRVVCGAVWGRRGPVEGIAADDPIYLDVPNLRHYQFYLTPVGMPKKSGQMFKIHLKRTVTTRLTLCKIRADANSVVVNELPGLPDARVCKVCSQIAQRSGNSK